jgi:hypothetical protein
MHPSEIVRANLMPNLGTNYIACDTCHLLKFTRLLFMPSLYRANKIFELEYMMFGDLLLNLLMVISI